MLDGGVPNNGAGTIGVDVGNIANYLYLKKKTTRNLLPMMMMIPMMIIMVMTALNLWQTQ